MRMKGGQNGAAQECKARRKREIPEKIRRPETSSSRNPTCKSPGATRQGIEPDSPDFTPSASGLERRSCQCSAIPFGQRPSYPLHWMSATLTFDLNHNRPLVDRWLDDYITNIWLIETRSVGDGFSISSLGSTPCRATTARSASSYQLISGAGGAFIGMTADGHMTRTPSPTTYLFDAGRKMRCCIHVKGSALSSVGSCYEMLAWFVHLGKVRNSAMLHVATITTLCVDAYVVGIQIAVFDGRVTGPTEAGEMHVKNGRKLRVHSDYFVSTRRHPIPGLRMRCTICAAAARSIVRSPSQSLRREGHPYSACLSIIFTSNLHKLLSHFCAQLRKSEPSDNPSASRAAHFTSDGMESCLRLIPVHWSLDRSVWKHEMACTFPRLNAHGLYLLETLDQLVYKDPPTAPDERKARITRVCSALSPHAPQADDKANANCFPLLGKYQQHDYGPFTACQLFFAAGEIIAAYLPPFVLNIGMSPTCKHIIPQSSFIMCATCICGCIPFLKCLWLPHVGCSFTIRSAHAGQLYFATWEPPCSLGETECIPTTHKRTITGMHGQGGRETYEKTPPTSGIVRHDSRVRPRPGNRTRVTLVGRRGQ
ncbi:hypothetical protein PR048_024014 [Dryococelus australis]|uniref:Uncharacterized protein n=1 Tax=Dryococelus australis TaxID=614101 RepID=A0ABQ9GVP0_9NEOP|nr:hypothetical protein PR048_024014 [Dryococelus australis]